MITYNFTEQVKSPQEIQRLEEEHARFKAQRKENQELIDRLDAGRERAYKKSKESVSIDAGIVPYKSEGHKKLFPVKHDVPLEELVELFQLVRPYLLREYRDELKIPGYLSFGRGYWISRARWKKYCLRTGAIWDLKSGKICAGSTALSPWLRVKNQYFSQGVKSLREWAIAQQDIPIQEEPFFHESDEMVQRIFYAAMFEWSHEHQYQGSAKSLWKIFSEIHGTVRTTKYTPDFNSSARMLRFLRWCEENDPQDFSVSVSHHKKMVTYTVQDNWYHQDKEMKARVAGKTPLGLFIPSDEELYNRTMEDYLRIPAAISNPILVEYFFR